MAVMETEEVAMEAAAAAAVEMEVGSKPAVLAVVVVEVMAVGNH